MTTPFELARDLSLARQQVERLEREVRRERERADENCRRLEIERARFEGLRAAFDSLVEACVSSHRATAAGTFKLGALGPGEVRFFEPKSEVLTGDPPAS